MYMQYYTRSTLSRSTKTYRIAGIFRGGGGGGVKVRG